MPSTVSCLADEDQSAAVSDKRSAERQVSRDQRRAARCASGAESRREVKRADSSRDTMHAFTGWQPGAAGRPGQCAAAGSCPTFDIIAAGCTPLR